MPPQTVSAELFRCVVAIDYSSNGSRVGNVSDTCWYDAPDVGTV